MGWAENDLVGWIFWGGGRVPGAMAGRARDYVYVCIELGTCLMMECM